MGELDLAEREMNEATQNIIASDASTAVVPEETVDASMDYEPGQLAPGRQVTLHFELSLTDGSIVDSNFEGSPVTFTVGDGNILPGFEKALYGMRAGDEVVAEIAAASAFGEPNPENVRRFQRFRFPADLPVEEGLMIDFADSEGNSQPGMVTAFDANTVEIDFNHPLAGKTVHFRVKLLAVSEQPVQ